jgi:hypothetical protein
MAILCHTSSKDSLPWVRAAKRLARRLFDLGCASSFHQPMHDPMLLNPLPVIEPNTSVSKEMLEALVRGRREEWSNGKREPQACIHATDKAAALVGGICGRKPHLGSETHELGLVDAFVAKSFFEPRAARHWKPEAVLAKEGWAQDRTLPDAVIDHKPGGTVIEVVGSSYTAQDLAGFLADYIQYRVELW